jgi:hypothetical protein
MIPIKEDFNERINFKCVENQATSADKACEDVSGTYSIIATFDASQCGLLINPKNVFTVYVTQKDCNLTVSYENDINPDSGKVTGNMVTFGGISLIGDITDIHSFNVYKKGSLIDGTGFSTLSGSSISGCIITKTITGTLVQ